MGKSRYIKDDKGVTRSVTTSTLGLEKPLLNENYNIDVHNRNMDKIDEDLTPIDDSYIIELFQHDGDTSRPRDYYTKEESDEKFATKEEVENIDLSNLATKEETNNALNKANEAFQRGDNVKTQLVDKLISEGLDVSTDNTFEELIGSIALGKKFATGILTGTQEKKYYPIWNGKSWVKSSNSQYCAKVNGLDFIPSMVLVFTYSTSSPMWIFRGYATTMFEKLEGFSYGEHITNIYPCVNHDGSLGVEGSKLYKGGFDIMFGGFSSFEQNKGILWVAYE